MSRLLSVWRQVKDLYLFLFRHALVVNAYVDDYSWQDIRHRNWGDDLNYFMLQELTGRPVVIYNYFKWAQWLHLNNYLCIGTLLDAVNYCNCSTIVWGTGVSGQERDFVQPKKICAVRGKLTHDFLISHHVDCPEVYGDPALLLPRYYRPQVKKKYQLGIIPHVVDQRHPVIEEIKAHHPEILMIDLAHYNKWTDVIDQICSCENIASSSLHGLIVSDAYHVPNCWIELSGKISGGHFKYRDYASSVKRNLSKPFCLVKIRDVGQLLNLCSQWKKPAIDLQPLIDSCPFKLSFD